MTGREKVNRFTFGKMKMYEDSLKGGFTTTGNEEVDGDFHNKFMSEMQTDPTEIALKEHMEREKIEIQNASKFKKVEASISSLFK